MEITLITTLPSLKENKRIKEEVEKKGFQFKLVDLSNFNFITDNQVEVEGLTDNQSDLIIIRGIFNSIKPISVLANSLKKKGVKIFDNNFIEHKYSIDKVTDLIKLAQEKISIPKTAYARDFSKYEELVKEIGFPVVIKSTRSGKGASVFKVDDQKSLKVLINKLIDEGKKAKSYLLQEFIDYKFDLRCLVIGEKVFTMRRIPGKGEFRANFSLGGSVEVYELKKGGKDLAIKALKIVDMSIGGVDILIDKDEKMYILEVNHTAGFVGMEKATKENIAKIFVEHAIKNAK